MKADNSTFGRFKAGATDIVIDDVAAIAKEAGDAIMAIYNGTSEADWKKIADFKADGSPLTKADTTANTIICDALKAAYPKIPIMSEENKLLPYAERKGWAYFWCVDPLDGTKEFIKRNGQFTVNIGLVKGTSPLAGVGAAGARGTGRVRVGTGEARFQRSGRHPERRRGRSKSLFVRPDPARRRRDEEHDGDHAAVRRGGGRDQRVRGEAEDDRRAHAADTG